MAQTAERAINPLLQLALYGQSPWYDYIRRGLLTSGELHRLITCDGLMGVTSNPSIFEKAIAGSTDYHESLAQLAQELTNAKQCYEALAIRDVQDAADLLYPIYDATHARDGYVSLEVDPELAFNTAGTIEEALRLYQAIGRENVMIKVPATPEGIPAVEALIGQGINVNVTLLFSVEVYEQVASAYIRGLAARAEKGGRVQRVASVASFFVSRIDTEVDHLLEGTIKEATDSVKKVAHSLMGKIAIANAKLAYLSFQQLFHSSQFQALKAKGAQVQRLLWASTGTKNPRYPDTYYVEELIGPDTVNTIPAATLTAFRDHGRVRPSLTEGLAEAQDLLKRLPHCGIDLSSVTQKLLLDGTALFRASFTQLITSISQKRTELLGAKLDTSAFAAFDQPNVQESKDNTSFLLESYQQNGSLPADDPCLTQEGLQLYVDSVNAQDLSRGTIKQVLFDHLGHIRPGDYVAINAYLPRTDLIHRALQDIRVTIRNRYGVATTLGYGPRFLHSTGQLHKGGPNTGIFFHLTADDDKDLKIPGEPYTFGVLKTAQAQGDFRCLTTHRRRIVRLHLGRDILGGLQRVEKFLQL